MSEDEGAFKLDNRSEETDALALGAKTGRR